MATVVALHAHPDDETLLTGGTLAKLAAAGHRTVLVVATDGHMATLDGPAPRLAELAASAAALGVARVAHLGYADSGHGPVLYADPADRVRFARADPEEAAARLAEILREEAAEILFSYDRNGGYGHRDHVRVHEVARRAAESTGGVRVLEATVPREQVRRIARMLSVLRIRSNLARLDTVYSAADEITHRIEVGAFASQRKTALAAHRSVLAGGSGFAALAKLLLRMPDRVLGRIMRWEWFVEAGGVPRTPPLDDVLRPARR